MFDNLWNELKEATSEDTLFKIITDKAGFEVHVICQTTIDKTGKCIDRCIMAVYPDGTLYPAHADEIVLNACHEAGKEIQEKGETK